MRVQVINPSAYCYLNNRQAVEMLRNIERAGRLCYNSLDKMTDTSYRDFILRIIKRGHESVIEHGTITMYIETDRAISHELVRHRIASYSQESTRYVGYNNVIRMVRPTEFELHSPAYSCWKAAVETAANIYEGMLNDGIKPENARSVLPQSVATNIAVTFNLREWRHFFRLRLDKAAHPDMRQVAALCYDELDQFFSFMLNDLRTLRDMIVLR